MSNDNIYDLAIIGGGIAGAASALRAAQYNMKALWIVGDKYTARRSRSQWVMNVDNMIGVHPDIMTSKLKKVWKKSPDLVAAIDELPHQHISTLDIISNVKERLKEMPGLVTEIPAAAAGIKLAEDGLFEIKTADDDFSRVRAVSVILSTGIMDRQPSIAKEKGGEIHDLPRWIFPFSNRESVLYCIRCEGHLTHESSVAIIGSSETAAQVALMLHERYGSVAYILTNGEGPAFEEETVKLLKHYGIEVNKERLVDVISGEGITKLHAFELAGGKKVKVDFALVSMGIYKIYNDLAREIGAELMDADEPEDRRHVKIDNKGETSVKNFFAVGDMALRPDERVMKQIYTAQEYAVRAVDTIDQRRRKKMRDAALKDMG